MKGLREINEDLGGGASSRDEEGRVLSSTMMEDLTLRVIGILGCKGGDGYYAWIITLISLIQ